MNIKKLTLDVGDFATEIHGGGILIGCLGEQHEAVAKVVYGALTKMDEAQATIQTLRDELAHKTRRVEYLEKVILDINKSLKVRCDEE